ncbi:Alkylglycerol monooxygenase [Micractinium conductrix]|uniref:Alkylglycerol monooxygenase n=1 Tax=Micractinium conductrix TaxID=554055 RepID=A0A2P6VJ68_9CHLO|nr:Alkylglycerol monooxygenase [Micractinium conductrix]|eukprot:PSC74132.1 Alkylglycerol monooxygenase [Micractinium conductrix]
MMLDLQRWLAPDVAVVGHVLPDVIGEALPLFFLLIAVEVVAAWRSRRQLYSLRQTISNLSAGSLSVTLGFFLKALHIWPFVWLHRRVGLLSSWPPHHGWALHIAALLVCDAGFYWQHRFMHATNLGWSAHVVHHSSPDFNLSTALRQGAGEGTFSFLFFLPLALFCPPEAYALHRGLNTVYQFFTHTQLIDRCWWPVELVMNTPSHHRVHHARNYGRRNFAGVLIVWDRLFGTFEEEQRGRPCIYGLDAQRVVQGTYNPLWHQTHHAVATLRLAASGKVPLWRALLTRQYGAGMVQPTVTDAEPAEHAGHAGKPPQQQGRAAAAAAAAGPQSGKLPAVGAPPGGVQHGQQPAQPLGQQQLGDQPEQPAWETRHLEPLEWYAAVQFFLLALPGGLAYLLAAGSGSLSPAVVVAGGAFSGWTTITTAWLCDGTAAAVGHELARLLAQPALALALAQCGALPQPWGDRLARLAVAASAACIVFLVQHLPMKGEPRWAGPARGAAQAECHAAEQELLTAVKSLGYPAAVFPGDEQQRAGIDAAIQTLEAATPTPSPLRQPGGGPSPLLLGEWKLVYASSGTYVTRTTVAQALLAASRLPGCGVADIQQSLDRSLEGLEAAAATASAGTATPGSSASAGGGGDGPPARQLRTSNAARLGLGPFGEWEVVLGGTWAVQDGSLARVRFDGFTLQLVGMLGLPLPRMAKVSVPVQNGRTAEFITSYLSERLRVARGATGNLFLFTRLP